MAVATRRAEELGFASVSVSDHTICTTGPESEGVMHMWPDWSVLGAYLATQTERIRIVTSLVVPYRPVFPAAKQIATIDQVAPGRVIAGLGAGWFQPEFEGTGSPFPSLRERLRALVEGIGVDEARIVTEAAVWAEKTDVTEELARLRAHLAQLALTLDKGGPMGRPLDFLLQELNREVNTVASKADDLELSQTALAAKGVLEKMREQVQNLE
jgi:hypothetical protein